MDVDLRNEDVDDVHRLVTSFVVPRPIGWISTRDTDGGANLAPYSYFNLVHTGPPVVVFAAEDEDGRVKDSPTNAIDTGEFVVNLVTERLGERMDRTAAPLDTARDEFEYAGLERAPARTVDAPRVAEADAHLECTLYDTQRIYSSTLVFGEVQYVRVDEALCTDGRIDAQKVDAVGRLGGPYFTGIDRLPLERSYEYSG